MYRSNRWERGKALIACIQNSSSSLLSSYQAQSLFHMLTTFSTCEPGASWSYRSSHPLFSEWAGSARTQTTLFVNSRVESRMCFRMTKNWDSWTKINLLTPLIVPALDLYRQMTKVRLKNPATIPFQGEGWWQYEWMLPLCNLNSQDSFQATDRKSVIQ